MKPLIYFMFSAIILIFSSCAVPCTSEKIQLSNDAEADIQYSALEYPEEIFEGVVRKVAPPPPNRYNYGFLKPVLAIFH